MDITDDTPITLPGRKKPLRPETNDGVVEEPMQIIETGPMSKAFASQVPDGTDPMDFITAIAEKLVEKGGGGSGGVPPAKHEKSIRRHNYLTWLLAILLGPGGALAVIYATSDRSKANEAKIEQVNQQVNGTTTKAGLDARVEQTEGDVRFIKVRVGEVSKSVDDMSAQQTEIVKGIKELKQENVDRLQRELDAANRELRRRRNRDDD